MEVQCDVCKGEEPAAVFCCADEAALCGPCDSLVHSANKLAGKHRRFSLLHPAPPHQFPLCDICKEKRALLFCQEDRAILCWDCDAPIHDANDLTRKHTRFLITGIMVSPFPSPAATEASASSYDTPSSVAAASSSTTTASAAGERPPTTLNKSNQGSRHSVVDNAANQRKKPAAADEMLDKNCKAIAVAAAGFGSGNTVVQDYVDLSSRASAAAVARTGGSSFSENLLKELPGCHVEDLLLESFSVAQQPLLPYHLQMPGEDPTPFRGEDPDAAAVGDAGFQPECGVREITAGWVAQVPQFCAALVPFPRVNDCGHRQHAIAMGMGGQLTELQSPQLQPLTLPLQQQHQYQHQHHDRRRRTVDDGFIVPEVIAARQNPLSNKRSRPPS